jgi:hypothetical protein
MTKEHNKPPKNLRRDSPTVRVRSRSIPRLARILFFQQLSVFMKAVEAAAKDAGQGK